MSSTAAFEARPAEAKKSPLQWSEERTVFVVEDDEPLRELLQLLMESAGFKAKAYDCAEAFLREVAPRPCGCLLLDIELPGMSGIALALKLARDGVQLPMILLSGRGDLLFAARKLGIEAAFVSKPFENYELLESVKRALELPKKIKS